jgi:hypothetical protein
VPFRPFKNHLSLENQLEANLSEKTVEKPVEEVVPEAVDPEATTTPDRLSHEIHEGNFLLLVKPFQLIDFSKLFSG